MAPDDVTDAAARAAYREKLRSISLVGRPLKGSERTTPVVDDNTGTRIGHQTEHWSGRVDATAEGVRGIPHPAVVAAVRSQAYAQANEG